MLEPTEHCRLVNPSSDVLEFRRVGMAVLDYEWKPFFGLGEAGNANFEQAVKRARLRIV